MTRDLTVVSDNVTSGPPRRSRTVGLVPFLYGTAGVAELPGLAIVRLLGELGIGEAAARGLLARMRRDEQLRGVRHGREVGYRLHGAFAAAFERLREPQPPPAWEGRFHALLHQVPERHRAYRDRLRRMATFGGWGVMQPGVLVAVRDLRAALAPVLDDAPPGTRLHAATLAVSTPDAAAIARTAWALDDLAARLRGHVVTLSAELSRPERLAPSAAALRRLVALRNAPVVDLVDDPGLPEVLLPPDWPGQELAALLAAVDERCLPAARAYVRSVLAPHRRTGVPTAVPAPVTPPRRR